MFNQFVLKKIFQSDVIFFYSVNCVPEPHCFANYTDVFVFENRVLSTQIDLFCVRKQSLVLLHFVYLAFFFITLLSLN